MALSVEIAMICVVSMLSDDELYMNMLPPLSGDCCCASKAISSRRPFFSSSSLLCMYSSVSSRSTRPSSSFDPSSGPLAATYDSALAAIDVDDIAIRDWLFNADEAPMLLPWLLVSGAATDVPSAPVVETGCGG